MNSPLNYLGGKSRLAEKIVAQIPQHVCYCEPFCGAAWVLFRKHPSKVEIINDMDGELAVFWRVIQNHVEEFLRHYRWAVVSRDLFDLEHAKDPSLLTDVQRAVRYFYIQKLGFGGKTVGRTFGTSALSPPGLNLMTLEETLLHVHGRLARVIIENLDACDCIRRYDRPTTFFYIDPPYWATAGYAVAWGEDDYTRLRDVLASLQGRFLLSLNDTAAVRQIFRRFRIRRISTTYSVSNGRSSNSRRAQRRAELLISQP